MSLTTCATPDSLLAFLAGELPPEEEGSVATHLAQCPSCEQLALQLSDDRTARELFEEHRRLGGRVPQPDLSEARDRLHMLGWFGGSTAGPGPCGPEAVTTSASGAPVPADRSFRLQVGRFEIVQPIGAGAFGVVYLARDPVLHRQVALKVARTSVLTDPDLKSRFLREAEALGRMQHANIIPVFEAGEFDDTCYLAVAYCEGPTLEQWLSEQSGPVDPALAARLVAALAAAVEHAHSQGILHRDIKPSNVLLDKLGSQAGESDSGLPFIPKLTDFGLAKIGEQQSEATLSGMLLGTPQYMAPEQAAGLLERIGPPTDVYSLGVVLYQLLTGQLPIRGTTTIDTLRRVLIDEPERPRALQSAIAEDLDAIVLKCLDKSPARRYATAGDLAADLRRFLNHQPTLARPLGWRQRAGRWIRRNPTAAVVLGLAALCLGFAAGGLIFHERQLSQLQVEHDNERAVRTYCDDLYAAGQRYNVQRDVVSTVDLLRKQLPGPGAVDLRGIEWHYLWAQTMHEAIAEAQLNPDAPGKTLGYQLCLSPDKSLVAASCSDGKLMLFQARTLKPEGTIATRHGEANGAAFSPDGTLIATAGDDGFVRIWDLSQRSLVRQWRAHEAKAYNAVFLEKGRLLATCGEEPVIRLWEVATGSAAGTLAGHASAVEAITVSPQEDLLASAGEDRIAIVWSLAKRQPIAKLAHHTDKLTSLAFSPDGKFLVTGGQDSAVVLWRPEGERRRAVGYHLDAVQTVAFGSNGRLLAGDRAGTIRAYHLGPQYPHRALESCLEQPEDHWLAHNTRVWSIVSLPNDEFVSSGKDGTLRTWGRGRSLLRRLKKNQADYYSVDFSRDGEHLFAVHLRQGIEIFDAATGESQGNLPQPGLVWDSLAVLKGREQVAGATQSGEVLIWNWRSRNLLHTWKFGDQAIQRMTYSPRADLLAIIAHAWEDVRLVNPNTGEVLHTLPAPSCTDCVFSPDGRILAVDTLNKLALFDTQTGRSLRLQEGHSATIQAIAFSPDGRWIATGSSDRTVRLWTAEGDEVAVLSGHSAGVQTLAFTPDGRSLVTGAEDGRLKVFHVEMRRELLDIPTNFRCIRRLSVAPGNRQIAVIGDDWEIGLITIPRRGEED